MTVKKVSVGQMWRSEQSGEVFVVTSLYKDVLSSVAVLRPVNQSSSPANKRAKVIKMENGESLQGFTAAELV
jgi:hypothetical protein